MNVPPPKDWQAFERHLRDLLEAHWGAPATMHGRTGQPQHGVDIYGQPDGDAYHGVQCKGHDGNLGGTVTEAELTSEIKKAKEFEPRLAHFILATTAPRDTKIQAVVRHLNKRKRKPFTAEVMFWDDILNLYDQHRNIFDQHYGFGVTQIDRLHQLRPPLTDFTGRQEEIADLLAHIQQGVAISGVQGLGGIGKTELAYVLADRLKANYPDAQLYLDLKGTSQEPLKPADVLAFVVRCFHPEAKLSDDVGQLQGLYYSTLAGKRVLLLMDNASGVEQIAPLCPPADGCVLLVTSRVHFEPSGLYARNLDTLALPEACALLRTICPRIAEAVEEIARLCGCLPLALRLAGSALACSTLAPADYVARLRAEGRRLPELDRGAKLAGVVEISASLALSDALLSDELRRFWYLLAVFPVDFAAPAAAAVWGVEPGAARDALDELHRRSVIEWQEKGSRYRLHDVVRVFAARRLDEPAHAADRLPGEQRHAEHYLAVLATADHHYLKGDPAILEGLPLADAEWSNIQAGAAWARDHVETSRAALALVSEYPDAGAYVLDLRLHPREKAAWLESAVAAARRLGDRAAEGAHLGNLGSAYYVLGEERRAIELYEQWLEIAREIGDRRGEGNAFGGLGNANTALGEPRRAIKFYEKWLAIAREIGDRRGEGQALGSLGIAYAALGEPRRAIEFYEQHLEIARAIGDRRGEGQTLGNLGLAYTALGETRRAIEYHQRDLEIARALGDRRGEGMTLGNLGIAYDNLGETRRAVEFHEQSLKIKRAIGDPHGESNVLGNLGIAYGKLGEPRRAIEYYEQSLKIKLAIADRRGQAITSWNLGRAYEQLDDLPRAAELMQVCVDYERELGHADAEQHAAYLAALRARLK